MDSATLTLENPSGSLGQPGSSVRAVADGTGTVTFLFTDLVESTPLATRVGGVEADRLRREHFGLLRAEVATHGGSEVKTTGDGLMTVFVNPSDALAAAVEMQRAVDRANHGAAMSLAMRVGISAGEAVTEDNDWYGDAVVEARRLCDATEAGHILVADVVRRLVGRRTDHRFESVGALELKGLPEPVPACVLRWEQAIDAGPVALPSTLSRAAASTQFVGRAEERGQVAALWDDVVRTGARRLVAIAGEPGIGKSRVAAELAADVHARGAIVMHGRCDEAGGSPYQPFVQAMTEHIRQLDNATLRQRLGPTGRELVRILPGLANRLPGLPGPTATEPEGERHMLFDAVDSLLASTAESAALMIVLDDVHWADQPTLLLLRHLVRSDRAGPALVVATYRETELGRTHALADALADLRREHLVHRVLLRGLPAAEVAAMVHAWPGLTPSAELTAKVHTETEGNPFFVEEVLRNIGEGGDRADAIPEGIREVIGRRLNRLSDSVSQVLGVAAVCGLEFDFDVLEAVSPMSGDEMLDALDEARAAGLVAEGAGHGRYAFAHALVRQTLYDELSLTRRVRLHWRIGEALAGRPDAPRRRSEIAHHLASGVLHGDVVTAVDASLLAAEFAIDQAAFEEAVELGDEAIGLLDQGDATEPERRARAHMLRGRGLEHQPDPAVPWTAYGNAVAAARAGTDLHLLVDALVAYSMLLQPDPTRILADVDDALGRIDDPPDRVRLLVVRVQQESTAWGRRATAPSLAALEEAAAITSDDMSRWSVAFARVAYEGGSPDYPAAVAELGALLGDPGEAGRHIGGLLSFLPTGIGQLAVQAMLTRADRPRLQAEFEAWEAAADEHHLTSNLGTIGYHRAAVALATGPVNAAKAAAVAARVTTNPGPSRVDL